MAKAKKLPSGNWRTQAYDYTDNAGKRHYKSFTAGTKKEAEYLAAEFALNKKSVNNLLDITFGQALDEYIQNRSSVLSPATIREYRRSRRCDLQDLMDIKVCNLSQDVIQQVINKEAQTHSPKSVRNMHGLLSAVIKTYRPDFALNTDLPKKVRPNIYVPSDAEISQLMHFVKGDVMELPILLAAFGPMRRGEICALHSDNISGNIVHVCSNMVLDVNKKWIIKTPKSYAGDRYIEYPGFVAEKWKNISGRLTDLHPNNITDRFDTILSRSGIHHFRFHDLRHYSASIQHALGVPDAYIMQRGGWGNDGVLKAVYRHAMDSKIEEMNALTNNHFESIMQHGMQHKK